MRLRSVSKAVSGADFLARLDPRARAIEEPSSLRAAEDRHQGSEHAGVAQPILAIVVSTARSLFRRRHLHAIGRRFILAVNFSPNCGYLERFVGRFASSALVVKAAISFVVSIGYFLTPKLTSVAVRVTD